MTVNTEKNKGRDKQTDLGPSAKYLTFRLSEETYGLDILKVREIIGVLPITRTPGMPSYARGVINLRGKVIPVVDLRLKFGMKMAETTNETCIIVVDAADQGEELLVGMLVDGVSEVLDISARNIDDTPEFDGSIDTGFISGIGKAGDKVIILLEILKIIHDK